MRVDCDQDAVLLKVIPGGDGGACHVGFRSVFALPGRPEPGALVDIGLERPSPLAGEGGGAQADG